MNLSLENLTQNIQFIVTIFQTNLPFVLSILGLLFAIQILNILVGYRLNILGIYPRTIHGLVGIPCSPFLHGNFNHLFFNSIPLFILINFVLMNGMHVFTCVTVIVVVLSGLAVWLIGRRGFHVGASNLIMGYWSYLLINAYQDPSIISVFLALLCIYYLGGLASSLITAEAGVSLEGHVAGFTSGLLAYYLCPMIMANYLV